MCLNFHLLQSIFYFTLDFFSFDHWLVSSVWFNFECLCYFLFHSIVVVYSFLLFLSFWIYSALFYRLTYDLSWIMFHVYLRMFIYYCKECYVDVCKIWLVYTAQVFISSLDPLLPFVVFSIIESRILKSLIIVVELPISPFIFLTIFTCVFWHPFVRNNVYNLHMFFIIKL